MAPEHNANVTDILALREALRKLSKREQQMLWLIYAEGFSHKEVAGIMNLRSSPTGPGPADAWQKKMGAVS